jgi:nucleotide sugar dehydrogenase
MNAQTLSTERVNDKTFTSPGRRESMETVGIFGLGQVGSAVARRAIEVGHPVRCVDLDESLVERINGGDYFPSSTDASVRATTDGRSVVPECDVVLVAVPTPLRSNHAVDLDFLEMAARDVAAGIEPGGDPPLVVVESTVPPGTTRTVVQPAFEEAGLSVGEDLHLGVTPERVDPGNEEWPLERIPRVTSALTSDGRRRIHGFYDGLLEAEVHPVAEPEIAESAKIVENAFRDVNIAFVNELARSFDELGIDTTAVLDAAATKPFGFMRFAPGAGVGGDCIPVDPYLLIERAERTGFDHQLLKMSRSVNDRMPEYVVTKAIKALNDEGVLPKTATVVLLGRAFKPGVADDRNSPYHHIRRGLEEFGVTVETFDPYFPEESTVESPYVGADGLVLVTDHEEFRPLDWGRVADNDVSVLVDGRNVYDPERLRDHGIAYVGVGR